MLSLFSNDDRFYIEHLTLFFWNAESSTYITQYILTSRPSFTPKHSVGVTDCSVPDCFSSSNLLQVPVTYAKKRVSHSDGLNLVSFFLRRDLDDITHRGIQCLFWWHCLPVFIQSEAHYHNSQVIRDILQLIGYNDSQSGAAPAGALHAVAQHRHAFHAWEYWETVWDAGERRRADSSALQTWVDVESVLSAGGVHRKWPSICGQGNVSPTPDAQANSRISPERCLMWRAARKLTGSHPGDVNAECALCLQAYAVLLTFSSHCLFSEKSRYCIVVRVALIYCWARAIVWL